MVLDTGSHVSLVDRSVLDGIPNVVIEEVSYPVLRLANGNKMIPVGKTKLQIIAQNKPSLYIDFYIYDNLPFNFLLGLDFCTRSNVVIDFNTLKQKENNFEDMPYYCHNFEKQKNDYSLRVFGNHNIGRNSGKWVTVKSYEKLSCDVIFTPNNLFFIKSHFIVNNAIYKSISEYSLDIFVINPTNIDQCLRKNTKVGSFQNLEADLFYVSSFDGKRPSCEEIKSRVENKFAFDNGIRSQEFVAQSRVEPRADELRTELKSEPRTEPQWETKSYGREISFNIGENLNDSERKTVQDYLNDNSHLFARNLNELTKTNLTTHKIRTVPHEPINKSPYRASVKERAIIEKQIDEMLEAGIIRESKSPYAAPVVIVSKPDGSYRFCVDYRGLNAVTIKDKYPIPRVDDLMAAFNGAKLFSTIDMASGYWQVPMAEEDIEKTAFVTHAGLYEYTVASFGLSTVPETYQRLIDKLIAGLRWRICVAYLDDIVVWSENLSEHMERLDKVFSAIDIANLRMNPKKCHFAKDEIRYLGWVLSAEGLRPDPKKVEAVKRFRSPSDKTGIKRFLGMCGYYRASMKNFAETAAPLLLLLGKNIPFKWGEEEQRAFDSLKDLLCNAPVLVHFDSEKPIRVHTDASYEGIGYVLCHVIDGIEHPFHYGSRTLKYCELNYTVTEIEALAAVWAIKQSRNYLQGVHFELVTDHHSLCWILRAEDVSARISRWKLKTAEYSYKIVYKSGKAHQDADALSRDPLPTYNQEPEDTFDIFQISGCDLSLMQKNDPWCSKLYDQVKAKAPPARLGGHLYEIIDNIVYRVIDIASQKFYQLCVPAELRKDILFSVHDDKTAAHLGIAKVYDKLRRRCYWPKMFNSVERYVNSCNKCQVKKPSNNTYGFGQLPETPSVPFHTVGCDILGKFPKTDDDNQCVIVVTDHCTRFAITGALPDQKADTVAKFIVDNVILVHGAFDKFLSDNGKCFIAKTMLAIMEAIGTKAIRSTAYHPQTNALVERFNRVLSTSLSFYCNKKQNDWDKALPYVTWAYNTSRHESSRFSPYYLLYGREPRLVMDSVFKTPTSIQRLDEMVEKLKEARELARDFVSEVQQKNKLRYDSNKAASPFSVGDLCLVFTPIRKKGLSPKLRPQFIGPMIIKEITSPVNVIVESEDGKIRDKVHICRLKKYNKQESQTVDNRELQNSVNNEEDVSIDQMVDFKRKYNKRFRNLEKRKSKRQKKPPDRLGFQ